MKEFETRLGMEGKGLTGSENPSTLKSETILFTRPAGTSRMEENKEHIVGQKAQGGVGVMERPSEKTGHEPDLSKPVSDQVSDILGEWSGKAGQPQTGANFEHGSINDLLSEFSQNPLSDPKDMFEALAKMGYSQDGREAINAAWDEVARMQGGKLNALQKGARKKGEAPDPRYETLVKPLRGGATDILTPEALATFQEGTPAWSFAKSLLNAPDAYARNVDKLLDTRNSVNTVDATPEQKELLTRAIDAQLERLTEEAREVNKREGFRSFVLQKEDMDALYNSPVEWLNSQFDDLYSLSTQGSELDSEMVRHIQQVVAEAQKYLPTINVDVETRRQFEEIYITRFNLMFMRGAIDSRGMEQIQGAASRLKMRGIMRALTFDEGRVGLMYDRLNEKLEEMRLKEGGKERHVDAEMIKRLQAGVEEEQMQLASIGVGPYAELLTRPFKPGETEEARLKSVQAEIRRSIRTAYDVLVSSQRHAVIVARGKRLQGSLAYLSDPGGAFNVYNAEQMLWEKFGIFNETDKEFLNEIKLEIATSELKRRGIDPNGKSKKYLLQYGTEQIQNLFYVNDIYSNGWRIGQIMDGMGDIMEYKFVNNALQEYVPAGTDPAKISRDERDKLIQEHLGGSMDEIKKNAKEHAKQFGLFFKIRQAGAAAPEANEEALRPLWESVREHRAEELIRLFRDTDQEAEGSGQIVKKVDEFFAGLGFEATKEEKEKGVTGYDIFKDQCAPIMNALRTKAMGEDIPRHVDFTNLDDEEQNLVNRYFESRGIKRSARDLMNTYDSMKRFINEKSISSEGKSVNMIDALIFDPRWRNVYRRTQNVDDAFLGEIEATPENSGITPVSERISSEAGADSLRRIMNDTANAITAMQKFADFIKGDGEDHKKKAAHEMATAIKAWGGQDAGARALRFTLGTYYHLAKQDWLWDTVGVGKLWMRRPSSPIERLYGPSEKPRSREELRDKLDEIELELVGLGHENAHVWIEELKHELEVRPLDLAIQKGVIWLAVLLLGLGVGAAGAARAGGSDLIKG